MGPGPSPCGTVLAREGAKVKPLLLPFKCGPSWFLWSRRVLQAHPQVLGFSQMCIVYGYLLVGFLVRETDAGKSLCCHVGDITSPTWDSFVG